MRSARIRSSLRIAKFFNLLCEIEVDKFAHRFLFKAASSDFSSSTSDRYASQEVIEEVDRTL